MDERRRLLERLFSREAAAEEPGDRVDPRTGATVRMTPSQWALAEYDRAHPPIEQARDRADRETGDEPGYVENAAAGDLGEFGETTDPEGEADTTGDGASGRGRWVTVAVAAVVGLLVGALGTVGVVAATGGVNAGSPQPTSATSADTGGSDPAALSRGSGIAGGGESTDSSLGSGADDSGLRTVTGQNIRDYFSSYDASLHLPESVTAGFVPGSFHLQVSSVSPKTSTALYAAQRGDGQYCLVAVVGTGRVAESCGNVADVATRGLTLTVESPAGGDDQALTVTWNQDGTLTDSSSPFVG